MLLCVATISSAAQGGFLNSLKKGLDAVERVSNSDTGTIVREVVTAITDTTRVDEKTGAMTVETTVTTPDVVTYRQTPPAHGSETGTISTTIPFYRLETGERYVAVDCSQYVERTRETRSALPEKYTLVDEHSVYAHKIDARVVEENYPYTSFFYLNDPNGDIINLSETMLDGEQREYSLAFTSTYAKKFPFYDAIRPMSQMMGVGSGMTSIVGQHELLTPENAPDEIKAIAADFFDNTQNGYIIAVEGRLETAERDRRARGLLQQNYLCFFDNTLAAEFAGDGEENRETVRFDEGYAIDFGERKVPLDKASDESRMLFDYIRANPDEETVRPFAGDATAKQYTFEYRFYEEDLMIFAMFYTPLTLRFDVRTFYDEYSDATYFVYFYSLGYDRKGVESNYRLSWDELRESIMEACGFDIDDYLLSPMDILADRMFATFECVKIDIEEFFAHSLRVDEYITMQEVVARDEESIAVDCGWLEKRPTAELVKDYITIAERVEIPTSTPGKWVREVTPGRTWKIITYIEAPAKVERRVRFPRYVTFDRGDKEDIAPEPKPEPAAQQPAAPKPDPVVYTVSPNSAAIITGINVIDIAEDARYTYLAGSVDGTSKIFSIDKQSGEIAPIYVTTHGNAGDRGDVKRMLADGRGGVYVEFSNHPIMLLRDGVFEPTKLHVRAGDENLKYYMPRLKGVMPDGGVLLIENYLDNQNVLVDPASGAIRATSKDMSFNDQYGMTAVDKNGVVWEPGQSQSYSLVSGFGTAAEPTFTKLDVGYNSPFKGRISRIAVAPDGGVLAASGFGMHRTTDGGKTWKHVESIYDYGSFDGLAANSKSEVWAATNTSEGYSVVCYDAPLTNILHRASEFDVLKDGAPLKLQTEPRLLFVDGSDNLWVVGGTYGAQAVLLFNPAGINGYSTLAAQKTVNVE